MKHTLSMTETLEVRRCPSCSMAYAATEAFFAEKLRLHNRKQTGANWYCPAGHSIIYLAEAEIDVILRERDRYKQENARIEEEKFRIEQEAKIAKAEIARQKRRSAAGVCPCCHRTFAALQRHMTSKHPQFQADAGVVVTLRKEKL